MARESAGIFVAHLDPPPKKAFLESGTNIAIKVFSFFFSQPEFLLVFPPYTDLPFPPQTGNNSMHFNN